MTPVQQRKWTHLFRAFDADKNGLVGPADPQAIVARACAMRGYAPGTAGYAEINAKIWPIWEHLEAAADRDGDHAVTLDEWIDYFDGVINGPAQDVSTLHRIGVEGFLDMVDLDGDDGLNRNEYQALLRVYGIDERLADISFPRLDLDGDGFIPKQDLLRLYAEWFHGSDPEAPGNYLFGDFSRGVVAS